jgi:Family of unknown function (DUF6345)
MATKGIEWVNNYHGRASDLSNNDNNAQGFYNKLSGTKTFEYGNDSAWDQDFEESGTGSPSTGTDSTYADNVDIVFFSGHGSSSSFLFGIANKDDGDAKPSELGLGNKQCEWLVVDACQFLTSSGASTRLGGAFKGLHYILGFHTICGDVKDRGEKFADKMNNGQTVRNAWINACNETEGSSRECAYLRADSSGTDTFNDHWHGKGFVSADPTGSLSFVYLKTSC